MATSPLRYATPQAWTDAVLADFDSFLLDHAAAEKKASGMAMSMLSHYPDRVELVAAMAGGREAYLLDRLLTASIIEARGAERFGLVAGALEPGGLKNFYQSIARSEERHYELFLELAHRYVEADLICARWDELLDAEADIVAALPIRAALH
jgi:tRNA-(ms[2]io[6]A)-hydroxylase